MLVAVVSTEAGHEIVAKIPFPDATDGAEQSICDAATDLFYLSVPEIKGNRAKGDRQDHARSTAVIRPAS